MNESDDIPPVIRRYSGDDELRYHYNRADREAGRQKIWEPPTGGFFRRNRALAIVLVDMIVVVLLFIIYLLFLHPSEGQTRIGGYALSGRVFVAADEILVTVTLTAAGGNAPESGRQPVVTVETTGVQVSDLAPRPDRERAIVLRLDRDAAVPGESLEVAVTIGDESRNLTLPVPLD